jgi:hypothetical protein
MLTRSELAEMRGLVTRVQKGVGSREDWSNLAALTLIWQGDPTVLAILADGYETFVRTCQHVYDAHAFRDEDYRHIYRRLSAAATRARRDRVH